MELTDIEKEVLRNLVKKNLKELEDNEAMPDQPAMSLGAEFKYDEFLKNLLKKL